MGLGLLAAGFSGSRSALIAVPVILLLAMVLFSSRRRDDTRGGVLWILTLLSLTLGTIALAILLAFDALDISLITGRSATEASSTNTRVLMLIRGLPLVADRPFAGYGPGLSGYVLGFANARGEITIDNYYLSLALDSGIPTLLVFVWLTFGLAVKGFRHALNDCSSEGLLCGLLAISIIGMMVVKAILSIPHNAPLLFLAMTLILAISKLPAMERQTC